MEYVDFVVGTKYESEVIAIEVVKKTYHFTTFKVTTKGYDKEYTMTFRRKEQFGVKDNGWLDPSTFTMMVTWGDLEIYACDFKHGGKLK